MKRPSIYQMIVGAACLIIVGYISRFLEIHQQMKTRANIYSHAQDLGRKIGKMEADLENEASPEKMALLAEKLRKDETQTYAFIDHQGGDPRRAFESARKSTKRAITANRGKDGHHAEISPDGFKE